MGRREQITDFIKYWAEIVRQHPEIINNQDEFADRIYSAITKTGVNIRDYDIDLKKKMVGSPASQASVFNCWKKYYQDNPDISCFVDINWSYFCQFVSTDATTAYSPDQIKVYIPLDGNHIEKGAELIFDFLTENKISHVSKVGREIRLDDIVVRLSNKKDTTKLLNFVEANPYLQEGLLQPNPFLFQRNGIALACDGEASYNDTICKLMGLYLKECRDKNRWDNVGYSGFYEFIADCYIKEFVDRVDNPLERRFYYGNDPEQRKNHKLIFSLILKTQNPSFDYQDFIAHFQKSLEERKNKESDCLLLECIDRMIKKYNNTTTGLNSVKAYLLEGKPTYITQEFNLRDRVTKSSMRSDIINDINLTHQDIDIYLVDFMEKYNYNPLHYIRAKVS